MRIARRPSSHIVLNALRERKTVRVAGARLLVMPRAGETLQEATEGAVSMSIPVGTGSGAAPAKKSHQSGRQLVLRHAIAFPLRLPFGPS